MSAGNEKQFQNEHTVLKSTIGLCSCIIDA